MRTLEANPFIAIDQSSREMSRSSGSTTSVQRIVGAFGLQPHRIETLTVKSRSTPFGMWWHTQTFIVHCRASVERADG